MSKLVLIRGLPGSGKSSMAKTMKGYKHFEADMYFEMQGKYEYDFKQISNAHAWCQMCVRLELERGNDVVVSNTFVTRWELAPYLRMTDNVRVVKATGDYGSEHSVPAETIERMRDNWEEL